VAEILRLLRLRIERASARAGRNADAVTLIAASKTVAPQRLRLFIEAGLGDAGENYVQEAIAKIEFIRQEAPSAAVRWHCIGRLQSNKAREAVRYFTMIHSVDRLSLAVELDKAARAVHTVQEVLLQVNVGGEASKAGCAPHELRALAQGCRSLPNLAVRGLMCLPPYHEDAEQTRPYFTMLRERRDTLCSRPDAVFTAESFRHLSMGMSNNFEVAIEEGATMVRIGTGLFGARSG